METLDETGHKEEYAQYLGTTSSMFQWALAASALLGGASLRFIPFHWLCGFRSYPPCWESLYR